MNLPDLEETRKLLGKQVKVRLTDQSEKERIIVEGQLLEFGQGGDFVILDEMGFAHYCWPMLEIEEVEE